MQKLRIAKTCATAAMVIAGTASATVARADDGNVWNWYIAAAGTASLLKNARTTIFNAPFPGARIDATNIIDTGAGGQAAVGHAFGRVRAEAEIGYTHNHAGRIETSTPAFAGPTPQDGYQNAFRYMANGYVDLSKGRFRPYIGGGIGATTIRVRVFAPRAPFPTEPPRELIKDSDTRFAYQLMAGAGVRLGSRILLTAQYRWLDAGTFEGKDSRGERFIRKHAGSNIDVGFRFTF